MQLLVVEHDMHIMKLLLTHFKYFFSFISFTLSSVWVWTWIRYQWDMDEKCSLFCCSCSCSGVWETWKNERKKMKEKKQRLFMFNNKIYFTTLMREWNVEWDLRSVQLQRYRLFLLYLYLESVDIALTTRFNSIEIQYHAKWIMKFHTNDLSLIKMLNSHN